MNQDQSQTRWLPIDQITPDPKQPRRSFDPIHLEQLADSIRIHGLLNPLIVTPACTGYLLIAGERRLRACRLAGLRKAPAWIRPLSQGPVLALIENIQRQDLSALEEAHAIRRLLQTTGQSQGQIARELSKSPAYISNLLRLLELDDHSKALLESGAITPGHARALLAVGDIPTRKALGASIVQKGLSVRSAERAAKALKSGKDPEYAYLQETLGTLSERLDSRIRYQGTLDKGALVIEYYSQDHLQSLLDALAGKER